MWFKEEFIITCLARSTQCVDPCHCLLHVRARLPVCTHTCERVCPFNRITSFISNLV